MIDGQHEYFGKRELVSPNLVGIFLGKVFVGIATNFVLLMKNSVIKICHTGNTSKLLNGGKAIFRSQMFNLRINDGRGGGAGLFIKKKNFFHLQCWTKLQAVNPLISSPEQYSMPLCWHPKITGVI